ncbi:carboxymethylenebutenolidase [Saccharospirillum sp. MSK14-1]|uniref:dienelactone hydrolase family protein n=1 Tax=Saccharospirillum sp. MSK14-1 TaxID=1897632 RepID=UPI000D39AF5F|nr:dienelactone hydrolase family protein [Saccharospirillum sp. MSK14-1]PTY36117.1 carboxymethylenebutenolidase [Saccharospirillum sp. MSK14-1]
MNASWIDIPTRDGNTYQGYLTLPPTGSGPGIVLLQEIWGVNYHIRTVADQFALSGYTVLAPDVFWRIEPRIDLDYNEAGNEKAFSLAKAVDRDQATLDIADAVDCLKTRDEVSGKTAVLGFCLGGQLAFRVAATGKPDAAVCYYGGKTVDYLDEAKQINIPIQFHHGGQDGSIPPDAITAIKEALAHHKPAEFFEYPDAGHGFNCWGRSLYNQNASALAQGRSLEFLAHYL